jgi:hypothetical protein
MAENLSSHPAEGRFRAVVAVLGLVGVLAVALAIGTASASNGASTKSNKWSSWTPSTTGPKALQEIADYVGPQYRAPDGGQLVAVTGGPLTVASLPAHIAVRSASTGNIAIIQGTGALFTLCGLGPHCSIASGKPSTQRMLLLRREALELALYTLRTQPDVDNVVVLMPPRPGERLVKSAAGQTIVSGNRGTATLFQRSQLDSQLSKPLADTVSAVTPTIASVARSADSALVNRLTSPNLFLVSIVEGQDATAYFVLDPLGP